MFNIPDNRQIHVLVADIRRKTDSSLKYAFHLIKMVILRKKWKNDKKKWLQEGELCECETIGPSELRGCCRNTLWLCKRKCRCCVNTQLCEIYHAFPFPILLALKKDKFLHYLYIWPVLYRQSFDMFFISKAS